MNEAAAAAGSREAAIEVEGITAGYGRKVILDDVSLSVRGGESVGLIGLNGAGKTTLLKSILDFLPISGGAVRLFGVSNKLKQARRALAYLPEQFVPAPQLKGYEFLSLSLGYFGLRLDRDAADRLAADFALDPAALTRRVTTYSKGMGQKLGLIATFMAERPLLLLDEPMSGLDPLARARLKSALTSHRAAGRTVFLSSHILSDIDALCDRILVIHDGAMLFDGPPAALKQAAGDRPLEDAFLHRIGAA